MALQVEVCNSLENYGGLKMIVSHYKTALPRLLGSFAVFLKIILSYAISFCNQLLQSLIAIFNYAIIALTSTMSLTIT